MSVLEEVRFVELCETCKLAGDGGELCSDCSRAIDRQMLLAFGVQVYDAESWLGDYEILVKRFAHSADGDELVDAIAKYMSQAETVFKLLGEILETDIAEEWRTATADESLDDEIANWRDRYE